MPTRVAHVTRRYGEMSQTFVADTVRELDQLGWEAVVVTLAAVNRATFPFPPDERLLIAGAPSLATRTANRLLRKPASVRRSARLEGPLAAARPGLVHAHFGWSAVDAMAAAARLSLPLVTTFHATDVTVFPHSSPESLAAYRRMLAALSGAIAVSRFTENGLRELGLTSEVAIIPAGVHLERFPYRPPDPEGTRLLFVGRQTLRKGLDLLIRALAELSEEHSAVTLEVVGDGPQREANEKLAGRLGLQRRVTFRGALGPLAVAEALQDASVLVSPSRTMPDGEAEGSPVATKEAQAVGLPVVATDCGGTGETLPPSRRHELVPEDDPTALARALGALLADRSSWPERAREGREWVEREFDWSALAKRTAAVYRRALEDSA